MVNMLDDHDLIGMLPIMRFISLVFVRIADDPLDGFGTYDDETQAAPVMSFIGSRGYFVCYPSFLPRLDF